MFFCGREEGMDSKSIPRSPSSIGIILPCNLCMYAMGNILCAEELQCLYFALTVHKCKNSLRFMYCKPSFPIGYIACCMQYLMCVLMSFLYFHVFRCLAEE